MMGGTNRDHEKEERNLPRDLPQGRPNSEPFLNFMRFHSMMGDFQKKDLLIEIELEAYFYFNKVPYHQKIRLVAHKLSYGGLNF
jgi:hypothetical protein